jgi:hypothetical protein
MSLSPVRATGRSTASSSRFSSANGGRHDDPREVAVRLDDEYEIGVLRLVRGGVVQVGDPSGESEEQLRDKRHGASSIKQAGAGQGSLDTTAQPPSGT